MNPFAFGDHQLRVLTIDGEPWWVARDVCDVLALRDTSSALKMVDDDEKVNLRRSDSPHFFDGIAPQVQAINAVNEPGLYALIFQSNKPEAKAFKRWVTHEVIPTIRKTGGAYIEPGSRAELDLMNDDTALDKLIDAAVTEANKVLAIREQTTALRNNQQWPAIPIS